MPIYICSKNPHVRCKPSHNCDKCGWNPIVSKRRLLAFCKKHHIKQPQMKEDEACQSGK